MDFGLLDFFILIIVIASAIYGAFKGFISQITSVASLILGTWCAFKFSEFIASRIKEWITAGETAIYILSFIIILIAVILLSNILGRAIEKLINLSTLGWLNRILGTIFCSIKWIAILSLFTYIINYIDATWDLIPEGIFADSYLYPHLTSISEKIFPYLQALFT